jgi:DnaJ-domain-containing protein 1
MRDPGTLFYKVELAVAVLFLGLAWFFRPKGPESNFQVREADLKRPPSSSQSSKDASRLADARMKQAVPAQPLRLEGIRINGAGHEVLGVSMQASAEEVQKAYRNLMKQYHPDKIGRPGTREWQDAQKIAEAINRAKEEMLKKFR